MVTHDLPSNGVYYGNPAVKVNDYNKWVKRQKDRMSVAPVYGEEYIIGAITEKRKQQMISDLEEGIGFIK